MREENIWLGKRLRWAATELGMSAESLLKEIEAKAQVNIADINGVTPLLTFFYNYKKGYI